MKLTWIIEELRKELQTQQHIASGALAASLRMAKDGNDYVVIGRHYSYWVNFGRRAGSLPPITAIANWVAIKGLPTEATWPIAKTIAAKGTPGQPYVVWKEGNSIKRTDFVSDTIERCKERIKEELQQEWKAIIFEKYRKEQ
jgi:hypothetical protein